MPQANSQSKFDLNRAPASDHETGVASGMYNWPVFLIGCHRSGTTLLRYLLDSHPNLACPPESKFISGLEAFLDYPQAMEGLLSMGFPRKAVHVEIRKLIDSFFRGYAKRHGKRRWIDKTPNYYRLLPLLDEVFDGRVLYLMLARHPLDCVDSLAITLRATLNHPDPEIAATVQQHGKGRLAWARYWNEVNEHMLAFSNANPDRCWTIRYEDLVRRTNDTLLGICNFLGEPFIEDLARRAFTQSHTDGMGDPKIKSTRGIASDRIGVWQTWPRKEIELLWRVVQSNAQEFGYLVDSVELAPLPAQQVASIAQKPSGAAAPDQSRAGLEKSDSVGVRNSAASRFSPAQEQLLRLVGECETLLERAPAILDLHQGLDLAAAFPDHAVFQPPSAEALLPYLDESVDCVVTASVDQDRLAEARRVAKVALLVVPAADAVVHVERKSVPAEPLPRICRGTIVSNGHQQKRALVSSYVPPEFDKSSGARRILDLIDFLIEDGWAVTFLSYRPLRERRYVRALERRGVTVHDPGISTDELFADGAFDLAIFAFWPVAEALIPVMRLVSPNTRIVVDSIDLHFLRSARGAFRPADTRQSPLLGSGFGSEIIRELNVYASADAVLAVSPKEAELINDFTADPRLAYAVPDCEDTGCASLPLNQRRGVVFIGYLLHKPNAQAVAYLCQEILPKVDESLLARNPVRIVGEGLSPEIRGYARGLPHVHMVGWVPSVDPYLANARISVAPLLHGAGTKRKVIQSIFAATPVVSTRIGVEGLNLHHGEHVLVADGAAPFADAMTQLLSDDALWERLASGGANQLLTSHGRDTVRDRFREVLAEAMRRDPKPALSESQQVQECVTADEYRHLVGRIRQAARQRIPQDSTVVVVSKGDDELVRLNGCRGWHFPQNSEGLYAGHYPYDGDEAIQSLEGLRSKGAQYLIFPQTAFWWLDHFDGLRAYLESSHDRIWSDEDCLIYHLAGEAAGKA